MPTATNRAGACDARHALCCGQGPGRRQPSGSHRTHLCPALPCPAPLHPACAPPRPAPPRRDTWGRLVAPATSTTAWMYCVGNHEIELTNGAKDFLSYETRCAVGRGGSAAQAEVSALPAAAPCPGAARRSSAPSLRAARPWLPAHLPTSVCSFFSPYRHSLSTSKLYYSYDVRGHT